jgi:hypothetical protein
MKLNYVLRAWEFGYLRHKMKVRNDRIDSAHRLEMALQVEAKAMSHYLHSLLRRAFSSWRSNSRLSALQRLVALAEDQLRAASTDYQKLVMGDDAKRNFGNRLTMASLPDIGVEVQGTSGMRREISDYLQRIALDDSSYLILGDKSNDSSASTSGTTSDHISASPNHPPNLKISTDPATKLAALMESVPSDTDAETEKRALISMGPLLPPSRNQCMHNHNSTAQPTASNTASKPPPEAVIVVREHVHSSHFGPCLRFALRRLDEQSYKLVAFSLMRFNLLFAFRWRKSTRYNSCLRFLATRLKRKLRIASLRIVWSEMLRQWAAAANRKIAVTDMFISQKKDTTER